MRTEVPQHVDVELVQTQIHALAVDVVDAADPIGFEDLLHRDNGGVVDEGVADHEGLPGAVTGTDDGFGIAHGCGEWLLDEDVLSRRERFLGELPMGADRRDDADGVDRGIIDELAVIGRHTHRRKALADDVEPLLREVRDGHGLGPRRFVQVSHDVRPPVARPDHTHTHGIAQEAQILGFAALKERY